MMGISTMPRKNWVMKGNSCRIGSTVPTSSSLSHTTPATVRSITINDLRTDQSSLCPCSAEGRVSGVSGMGVWNAKSVPST